MSLSKIIDAIESCLIELDWLNAYYWVFGIYSEEVSDYIALWDKLLQRRNEFRQAMISAKRQGRKAVVTNAAQVLTSYNQIAERIRSTRELWNNNLVKALCSDQKLREIALKVKESGPVAFSKDEVEKHFDLSPLFPSWDQIPDYTVFLVGGGIGISSPEFDMFEAMCWCYDEAVRTRQQLDLYREKVNRLAVEEEDIARINATHALHALMCRQTVVNSFLLVEAFLNSLAYVCLSDSTKSLTNEQRLFLSEKTRASSGKERTRFVSTQDKLHEWVKIISPRNQTFDKGKNPVLSLEK